MGTGVRWTPDRLQKFQATMEAKRKARFAPSARTADKKSSDPVASMRLRFHEIQAQTEQLRIEREALLADLRKLVGEMEDDRSSVLASVHEEVSA